MIGKFKDLSVKPPVVEQEPQRQVQPDTIPAKYRGNAAADAQAMIEAAADKVFSGVDESVATEAARRAMSYPAFSAATAEASFATFRDEVLQERE